MQRFTVLKNLRLIGRPDKVKDLSYTANWKWEKTAKELRDNYVIRMMRKHFNEDEVQKVLSYRRSNGSDEAVIADFMTNEFDKHWIIRDEHYQRAIRVVREQMRPNRILHPVSYPDLRTYNWTLNVSAERPWTDPEFKFKPHYRNLDAETGKPKVDGEVHKLEKQFKAETTVDSYLRLKQSNGMIESGGATFHNLYNEIFFLNRALMHQIKNKEAPFWDGDKPIPYETLKLHLRTHVVPEDKPDKVRAVFGAPKLLLMAENMFIWPLQASYQVNDTGRLFWNREIARGGFTKLMNEFDSCRQQTFISMDWSGFDRRLLHEMIDDVHDIWKSYFDFSMYERTADYPTAVPSGDKMENLWQWMTNAIKRTPVELPDGTIWEWNYNGFGSGYQQTQLMDTFCNMLMTYTVLSSLGINIESEDFKSRFQGDDAILGMPERVFQLYGKSFLSRMAEKALYYFNAILSDDKSSIGNHFNDVYCLGYNNSYGQPYRMEDDLLSHLMYPEKPQDMGRLAASAMGLAYAALGCSERFYNLTREIFFDLTLNEKVSPNTSAFKWMKKSGMEEILEQLKSGKFPSYQYTMSLGILPIRRTRLENNRNWPLFPTVKEQRVYFLDPL